MPVAELAKTFRQDFKARLDDLEAMREFTGTSVQEFGLDSVAAEQMKLCVDEAATNIVEYGYAGDEGILSIEVFREGDEVVVKIMDDAAPFDPDSVGDPDLSRPLHERAIGGMGVHLMRTLTDGLSHSFRPDGGNELVMRKRVLR